MNINELAARIAVELLSSIEGTDATADTLMELTPEAIEGDRIDWALVGQIISESNVFKETIEGFIRVIGPMDYNSDDDEDHQVDISDLEDTVE